MVGLPAGFWPWHKDLKDRDFQLHQAAAPPMFNNGGKVQKLRTQTWIHYLSQVPQLHMYFSLIA